MTNAEAALPSDFEALFEGIPWHQRWEIAAGIFTPGGNPVDLLMSCAAVPQDLTGLRVLDIGAWNGCFSFECERRGAAEVVAIGPEPSQATGFDKLKSYLASNAVYRQGTVYSLDPDAIGTFDVVICFGVFYHLRHPLLALDMIRRVCRKTLHIETAGIDENLVLATDALNAVQQASLLNHATAQSRAFEHAALADLHPVLPQLSLAQFYRAEELNRDSTNWFAVNQRCLEDMLASSGFLPTSMQRFGHRIAAACDVLPGYPEWMGNSGEGIYYDVICRPVLGRREVYLES